MSVVDLRLRLERLDKAIAQAERLLESTTAAAEAATPGGLTGYDPAILSGIRRKPDRKGDERRWAAYDRQAEVAVRLDGYRKDREVLVARIARAERDAAAPRDLDSLKPGDAVRDSSGWHRVARVNAKSVTVETGYSWTDRISLDRVIETRSAS